MIHYWTRRANSTKIRIKVCYKKQNNNNSMDWKHFLYTLFLQTFVGQSKLWYFIIRFCPCSAIYSFLLLCPFRIWESMALHNFLTWSKYLLTFYHPSLSLLPNFSILILFCYFLFYSNRFDNFSMDNYITFQKRVNILQKSKNGITHHRYIGKYLARYKPAFKGVYFINISKDNQIWS